MTLIETCIEAFKNQGMELVVVKELNSKFKCKVVDTATGYEMGWEIEKTLQWNSIKSFTNITRKQLNACMLLFPKERV